MKRPPKVAIVGATGLVGREILNIMGERSFAIDTLVPLASSRSAGQSVEFGGRSYRVEVASERSFEGVDLVLMSAGADTSRTLAPAAVAAGAWVVDNSSAWRQHAEVPLVVPEVNADALRTAGKPGIVANPNCSTIQMMVALAPLHRAFGLKRLVVSTYQAVSGSGQAGVEELGEQVTSLLNQNEVKSETYPRRIAFNCLPHIDRFTPDGDTREEEKVRLETRKILSLPALPVMATCVRVAVFNGHSISVWAEFEREPAAPAAKKLLAEAPGVTLLDDPSKGLYPTVLDVEGQDSTFVGRVRRDPDNAHALGLWCVADNLRKGAATNTVQIAEALWPRG